MNAWVNEWMSDRLTDWQRVCCSAVSVCFVCHICMINKFPLLSFFVYLGLSSFSVRFSARFYLWSVELLFLLLLLLCFYSLCWCCFCCCCCCCAFNAALEVTLIVGDAIYENYCKMMRTRTRNGRWTDVGRTCDESGWDSTAFPSLLHCPGGPDRDSRKK